MSSCRKGQIWAAGERGNLKLKKCEVREYSRMKSFIRANPGCTMQEIKGFMGTWRIQLFLAYGAGNGDLRGSESYPEKWWLNE